MAGLMAAGILLVTPGFITDIAGFLLLVPLGQGAAAERVSPALLKRQYHDVYDRLRLSAL